MSLIGGLYQQALWHYYRFSWVWWWVRVCKAKIKAGTRAYKCDGEKLGVKVDASTCYLHRHHQSIKSTFLLRRGKACFSAQSPRQPPPLIQLGLAHTSWSLIYLFKMCSYCTDSLERYILINNYMFSPSQVAHLVRVLYHALQKVSGSTPG